MDTLNIGSRLLKELPFLQTILSLFPMWAWIVLGWTIVTFLLKPYINAVIKLYQPKIDVAAQKTPSFLKRLIIEAFRLVLFSTQLPFTIWFVLTPKERRLRVWRKNEVVFYVWLLSSHFPSWKYYWRVRSWFETNVYLDKRTSYTFPEPLKQDGPYIKEKLELDQNLSHENFLHDYLEKGNKPILRVGAALSKMNPIRWMGKIGFILWILYWLMAGWVVSLNTNRLLAVVTFIAFFIVDRMNLNRLVLRKAKRDPDFFHDAVRLRVIQLHW